MISIHENPVSYCDVWCTHIDLLLTTFCPQMHARVEMRPGSSLCLQMSLANRGWWRRCRGRGSTQCFVFSARELSRQTCVPDGSDRLKAKKIRSPVWAEVILLLFCTSSLHKKEKKILSKYQHWWQWSESRIGKHKITCFDVIFRLLATRDWGFNMTPWNQDCWNWSLVA